MLNAILCKSQSREVTRHRSKNCSNPRQVDERHAECKLLTFFSQFETVLGTTNEQLRRPSGISIFGRAQRFASARSVSLKRFDFFANIGEFTDQTRCNSGSTVEKRVAVAIFTLQNLRVMLTTDNYSVNQLKTSLFKSAKFHGSECAQSTKYIF